MTPLDQLRTQLDRVRDLDPRHQSHEDLHTVAVHALTAAITALEVSETATRPTVPCDVADGPTVLDLYDATPRCGLYSELRRDMAARQALGVERHGALLRYPWQPAQVEAYQEALDLIAYLLVAPGEARATRLLGYALLLAESLRQDIADNAEPSGKPHDA